MAVMSQMWHWELWGFLYSSLKMLSPRSERAFFFPLCFKLNTGASRSTAKQLMRIFYPKVTAGIGGETCLSRV